jgi:hypothetical protein
MGTHSDRIRTALSRIDNHSKSLAGSVDRLNDVVDEVNKRLQKADFGIELHPIELDRGRVLDKNGYSEDERPALLGFGKNTGQWRLEVFFEPTAAQGASPIRDYVPLEQCSRQIRLHAVEKLPELLEAIQQEIAKRKDTVDEVVADLMPIED